VTDGTNPLDASDDVPTGGDTGDTGDDIVDGIGLPKGGGGLACATNEAPTGGLLAGLLALVGLARRRR
jgi:MYXO-CTERM domain-containing protein